MLGSRKSGHATGMAGEFFVMEHLYRKGYEPALTLGNAKSIDILAYNPATGKTITISVKAVCKGDKWGVGRENLCHRDDMIFVFLLYRNFDDLTTTPEVWVIPAKDVEARKLGWLNGTSAIYYGGKNKTDLREFKDAWHLLD